MIKSGFIGVGLVLAVMGTCAQAEDQWTVLKCGSVLDVENKKTLQNQQVLIKNDTITKIGTDVQAPGGAKVVDLSKSVCLPGLMDMHAHLVTDLTSATLDQASPTQSYGYNALMAMRNAQTLLSVGFTTIRVPGDMGYYYPDIEVRNAINRGEYQGPRMLVAPHAISALGGHGDYNSYAPDLPHKVLGPLIADGPEEIRKAVREEIKYGADWIKVMASGGVMSQHDDPEVAAYSPEEFKAFADEAHRYKKKITAHAHGDAAIRAAVEAGFDSIEHATMMEEATAKLMAKQGTYYIPTLYVLDWILDRGATGGISANNYEKAQLVGTMHSDSVKMAYKHNIKILIGSDPIFPMKEAIKEFQALAKRIPDNWYVLQAGTINSAEMLGLKDKIGSIVVGKKADIVATPASPIDDISNIEKVSFVMKSGDVVRNDS
ncbi:metal-dependent hydrolase family protein [Kordiimonas pumila]|uniref:Amidohydrolase family protein n=1 Tax=Kordiimonas pumila TaxID=2161677 RepID=A0ABV7D7T0_9PROT|nr:amidohydrolase family protein [Kordiimonas pumila]